ncbi:hypothetical protein INR49_030454, partial [Caranx melampygus]
MKEKGLKEKGGLCVGRHQHVVVVVVVGVRQTLPLMVGPALVYTKVTTGPAHRKKEGLLTEISVSLLSVIVTFCGIVLLSVSLFVSWKLCWLPWRDKEGGGLSLTSGLLPGSAGVGSLGGAGGSSLLPPLLQRKEGHSSSSLYPTLGQQGQHHPHFSDLVGLERGEVGGVVGGPHETQEHSYLDMDSYPNNAGTLKLSQTSPDVPNSEGGAHPPKDLPNAHSQQQVTSRPKPMTHQLSSPDFHGEEKEQVTSIGQIKPELYRPKGDQGEGKQGDTCGKISFLLRYAFNTLIVAVGVMFFKEGLRAAVRLLRFSSRLRAGTSTEQLVVKILKALDLPAKDANGFSDPYVKIYLLPDRKKKFQTKVPPTPKTPPTSPFLSVNTQTHKDKQNQNKPPPKLHFSVYDFDRFSRHDLIGQVVVDNLLDFSEGSGDKPVWRDIVEGTAATNLKAMDLTGFSDPYVKASLICDGRRLKKRKTSIKKNTLNPTYNEALVFDIPNENIESVSIIIAVMDYD